MAFDKITADNERWMKVAEQFHCLWDPEDPGFPTRREHNYLEFLAKYATVASVPDDLVTLKLKLAAYHKLKTGYIPKSACMNCLSKSIDITVLLPDFPCIWDIHDLNHTDDEVRARCLGQLLERYNSQNKTSISMDQLTDKISMFLANQQQCLCPVATKISGDFHTQASGDSHTQVSGDSHTQASGDSHTQVSGDTHTQASGDSHTQVSGDSHIQASGDSHTQAEPEATQQDIVSNEMQKPLNNDMIKLLAEFPCLWDPKDVNYNDATMKTRARELMLEKFNAQSSVPMDMEELEKKLHQLCYRGQGIESRYNRDTRDKSTRFDALLKEFPCLWDPENLDYMDHTMSARARKQLLEKFNAESNIQIDMKKLKRKLKTAAQRRKRAWGSGIKTKCTLRRFDALLHEFPCLWDPEDLNFSDNTIRARARKQLLEKYNAESNIQIDMKELKVKLRSAAQRKRRYKGSGIKTKCTIERFDTLLQEFPCLWDHEDLNFTDNTIKARARKQLLEKYNAESSIRIDMKELKRKLKSAAQRERRYKGSGIKTKCTLKRFDTLLQEFPCLWDPEDLNFTDNTIRARARKQLLEKYNAESSIQIDMNELKVKLQSAAMRRYRSGIRVAFESTPTRSRFEEMLEEFPCLWDSQDSNFNDYTVKTSARQQFLEKYNAVSSVQIDMADLTKKLKTLHMRRWRLRKSLMEKGVESSAEATTSKVSQSSDLIASLHAINSQSLRYSNDSRGSFDSTEALSPEYLEEVVVEPERPIHQTPQCAVCGVTDENCINVNDTPYVSGNMTTLALNNLHVALDFNKSKTVCQNCDTKLKEIFNFVTLVKDAQDNLKIDATDIEVKEEPVSLICDGGDIYATEIDDEIDLKDLDIDSISVTDTEFIKHTVNTYLAETVAENPRPRKKRRVYIDINSRALSYRSDGENKDNINLIPEESPADDEIDVTKETVFADKNTGVIIEVLKRVTKNGDNREVTDINRTSMQTPGRDDRSCKKDIRADISKNI